MTPKISLVAVCCSNDSLSSWNKPHILDGDDGLIGEGFKQLDLRRSEGAHLDATCGQRSNEFLLLTKGNGQKAAQPTDPTIWKSFCARTSGM